VGRGARDLLNEKPVVGIEVFGDHQPPTPPDNLACKANAPRSVPGSCEASAAPTACALERTYSAKHEGQDWPHARLDGDREMHRRQECREEKEQGRARDGRLVA